MAQKESIDHGQAFDWGKISKEYARYRDIYPEEFYQRIIKLGLCVKGQRVLDLGTGTGVLPRNMYQYGAEFVGADISANQITEAKRLSKEQNMSIKYMVSSAETIDLPQKSFDVVTACQCFLYFDPVRALFNIHRLLKEDGHLCILFMAYLPEESEIARQSETFILNYNPSWTGANMRRYKPVAPEGAEKCFTVVHAASGLPAEQIAAWEKEHLEYLKTVPERFIIPHYVTMLDLLSKG